MDCWLARTYNTAGVVVWVMFDREGNAVFGENNEPCHRVQRRWIALFGPIGHMTTLRGPLTPSELRLTMELVQAPVFRPSPSTWRM